MTDTGNNTTFLTTTVNAGSTPAFSSFTVSSSLLSKAANATKSFAVGLANTIFQVFPKFVVTTVLPANRCFDQNALFGPKWTDFAACSSQLTNKRVLVVVHGMMSCVEEMSIPFTTLNANYDAIVGFDYDWTQHLTDSGTLLAAFLDKLSQLGARQIDILAHSEGVPVSLYGASQAPAADRTKITNFVGLAGPILGTPVAASPDTLLKSLLHFNYFLSSSCPVAQSLNLISLVQQPFQQDLQKNSVVLTKVILPAVQANLTAPTRIFLAGGANPTTLFVINLNFIDGDPFAGAPNDGIVGLDSALGFNSGLTVHPLPPFQGLFHSDLPNRGSVIGKMADQISSATLPILNCQGSNTGCAGAVNSSFTFAVSGFDPAATSATIFRQDSSGTVLAMATSSLQTSPGNLNLVTPACVQAQGLFSIFAFGGKLASNNVMQTVSPASCPAIAPDTITTLAGTSVPGYSGDFGQASGAQLNAASGIAVDQAGNLFVADTNNNAIRRIDAITGVITTYAGTGVGAFFGDGGTATSAELNRPVDVTVDRAGNIYIADAFNVRIRKVDALSGIITTVAGNGVVGFSGDGGLATDAALNFPNGVKLDGKGNIYFGDSQNNRVRRVDGVTGIITTVAGNGIAGFAGDGGLAIDATLNFPSDVRVDVSGNLYFADFLNNRIRKVDTTGTITTVAGNGSTLFVGDGGPATDAGIHGPLAITTDAAGNLYIGAISEQHIRVVNTSAAPTTVGGITIQPGQIQTIAGVGIAGYAGDGGPATNAQIDNPTGLATDGIANLFFTDSGNSVIRKVTLK
ncbi:MAG TPA: hypothetical protein VF532_20450 [Candidatus Angelobacter sp.]